MPTDNNQAPLGTTRAVVEEQFVPPATPPPATAGVADNQFGAGAGIPDIVTKPNPPGRGGRSGVILAVIGVLFLVGAVGAGITLLGQRGIGDIGEQAAPADKFCGGVTGGNTCNQNDWCWMATAVNVCLVNGQPQGATEYFAGNSAWDGQVTYTCADGSDEDGAVKTVPGNKIGGNDAKCPGGPPSTPKPTPTGQGLCDNSCTKDSDCAKVSPAGAELVCNTKIGKCVNRICPNDTISGNRCDCRTAVQKCGEPCGSGYPLCGEGSSCRYIVGPSCTAGTTSNPTTRCIPNPPPSGWTLPKCVARDQGNSYALFNGKNPTQADINAACNPPQATTGQCLNVKVYDKNFTELTAAQRSALKAGDIVRVTVSGTATNGQVTKARFTVNGNLRAEVTQKKPNSEEFYDEFQIPASGTLTIKGEIFVPGLDWF